MSLPQSLSEKLNTIEHELLRLPDTPMGKRIKLNVLLLLYLRYERVHFDSALTVHPHVALEQIVDDSLGTLHEYEEILSTEDLSADRASFVEKENQEQKHEDLFNVIWNKYDDREFQEYVDRYKTRISVNDLGGTIEGARCIDFGCGNGVFCFALVDMGAAQATGIDIGEHSIEYARRVADRRGVADKTEFKVSTVYDTGYPDGSFDFAIQNGVFHHLDEPRKANEEVFRVLRPGGKFWTYVNGSGSLAAEILNLAVRVNTNVSSDEVFAFLTDMNIGTGKKAFLTDGFKATYAFTTYDELVADLEAVGFKEFSRVVGGFPEDYDHDKVAADPYGPEKFGEGNLRVLATK